MVDTRGVRCRLISSGQGIGGGQDLSELERRGEWMDIKSGMGSVWLLGREKDEERGWLGD